MANSPFVFPGRTGRRSVRACFAQRTKILGRHRYSSNLKKFPSSETVQAIVSDLVAPTVVLAASSREQIAFTDNIQRLKGVSRLSIISDRELNV
jgi:hypothetical protein